MTAIKAVCAMCIIFSVLTNLTFQVFINCIRISEASKARSQTGFKVKTSADSLSQDLSSQRCDIAVCIVAQPVSVVLAVQ
jgi:hypothetical protein